MSFHPKNVVPPTYDAALSTALSWIETYRSGYNKDNSPADLDKACRLVDMWLRVASEIRQRDSIDPTLYLQAKKEAQELYDT